MPNEPLLYVNGDFKPLSQATISVLDQEALQLISMNDRIQVSSWFRRRLVGTIKRVKRHKTTSLSASKDIEKGKGGILKTKIY